MNSLAASLGMECMQFLKQPHVCVWRICFGRLCHTCGVAMHEEKSDVGNRKKQEYVLQPKLLEYSAHWRHPMTCQIFFSGKMIFFSGQNTTTLVHLLLRYRSDNLSIHSTGRR